MVYDVWTRPQDHSADRMAALMVATRDGAARLQPRAWGGYETALLPRSFLGFSISLRSAARSFLTAEAASRSMRR